MKLDLKKYELLIAAKCLSDKDVSELCGVGRSTLTQIKKGNRNPMPQTLGKIAKVLEVDVTELIEN
ncbi:MAG TPA: helix-turn-helix transcriptional regulator [Clostridiales bacterium]|nr:helix-turn-helix transcriptional regulator [Clostridiales bacterium]